MNRTHRDTLPPVEGSLSISPGPTQYEEILSASTSPIVPGEEHEGFIGHLMRILMDYGVTDVARLTLSRGPGGRDCLSVTLGFGKDPARSYRVVLPFRAEPFVDPAWVATELLRQSTAARMSLYPEHPSPGAQYRKLMTDFRRCLADIGKPMSELDVSAYREAMDRLWEEMSVDEARAIEQEFPALVSQKTK